MNKGTVTKKTVATKYRQGNGWIVSTYNKQYNTWTLSQELSYSVACRAVRDARKQWNTEIQNFEEI